MRFFDEWRRAAAQVVKWLGYGTVAGAIAVLACGDSIALGQGRGRGGGGGRGNGGGGGGGVRIQSGGGGGGQVRMPTVQGGGQVHVPTAGAQINPGAGAQVRLPQVSPNVGVQGQAHTTLRPTTDGGAQIHGSATTHVPAGVRIDPSVAAQANVRHSPSWANLSTTQRAQVGQFRTNMNTALQSQLKTANALNAAANANLRTSQYLAANPNRAQYWGNWGTSARNSFLGGYGGYGGYYGGSPLFNYGFWNARSLIGLGLGGYGYGLGGGYGGGLGGYGGLGGGYGGWWGYQPWLGYQPWSYWYGNPGWGGLTSMFSGYGWNQPYYYDYGPGGNVVYSGNQVLVNGQPVGTPTDYSLTAAQLATVDPATVGQTKPQDWMALGTFTLSTAEDERDPARVMQLAINKEGLISGTMFNKKTEKTYTVQGRVDKETQRVAFTIGNSTDLVLETGIFNLTQQETPVLAHLGPDKTATYLLARLPEPKQESEPATPPASPLTTSTTAPRLP